MSYHSILVLSLLGAFVCYFTSRRAHSRAPLPPGPKGLPVLGNILDIPLDNESQTYTRWAKEYGPIVSVHIMGQRMVFLNTYDVIRELYETRSALYSNRPFSPMLHLMGYAQWVVGLMQPDQRWSLCRKLMTQNFNPQAVQKWHSYELREVHRLLAKLLDDPKNFFRHADRAVVNTFMMILYGYETSLCGEDYFVAMHDKSLRETEYAISNGAYLVNLFPTLRYVPQWMVGAGFQRDAKKAFVTCQKVLHEPVQMIKEKMTGGAQVFESFASSLLEEGHDEFTIKQTAATAYNAGVNGSKSAILASILAMTLFPEAQRKCQQEIDSIIGNDRLPDFKDRGSLPYTEAFVKEIFRWAPIATMGLPRLLPQDDIINGYFIPAGSIVLTNMWAVLHDETRYPKAFDFKPERYLDGSSPDPKLECFGFGKRICPGRHLVDSFVWLAVVSILAVFNARKEVDIHGVEIPLRAEYSSGLFSSPLPFNSVIRLRSESLKELIHQAN